MLGVLCAFVCLAYAQDPSGTTYSLEVDGSVQRSLVASEGPGADTLAYHTYIVTLDEPVGTLTIQVDGGEDDVDLVTQPGSIIERFADASYQGLDNSPQHNFSYVNPPLGEIYIDVVNKTDAPISYTLTVTARDLTSATSTDENTAAEDVVDETIAEDIDAEDIDAATADATPPVEAEVTTEDTVTTEDIATEDIATEDIVTEDIVTEDIVTEDIVTEDTPNDAGDASGTNDEVVDAADLSPEPTGNYGALELGETVIRSIVSAAQSNGLAYHVYVLELPANSPNVTISVRGENDANIDMVTNAGTPVTRYSEADFNGVGPETSTQVSYADAAGARIYIDVVSRQNQPLAYTLQITPDLTAANVVRGGVLEQAEPTQVDNNGTGEGTETTSPEALSSDDVLPDGTYGVVPIGNVVTASIAPAGPRGLSYNTYLIEVTEPLDNLTIDVRSLDGDPEATDLVVQRGAVIETYDDADYNSFDGPPSFTYTNPEQGVIYYVDVVNLSSQVVPYELRVSSTSLMTRADQANDRRAAANAEVIAPSRSSSLVSELIPGQDAYGELSGKSGVATFHTYTVPVPAGMVSLEIELDASRDLDLATQVGDAISDYLASSVYFANSLRGRERVQIDNPTAGLWYVDVVNSLGEGAESSYTLTVTVR